MNILDKIENKYIKTDVPEFKSGDRVKVNLKIKEENKGVKFFYTKNRIHDIT